MTPEERQQVIEIRQHLADLHTQWQNDPNHDGHCKMSEGLVEIYASYPNWFDADSDKAKYLAAKPTYGMNVYSYLFGPSRMHEFATIQEAYNEVMSWTYEKYD